MQGFVDRFRIKTPSLNQQIKFLSGGNQQKVLISRWLMRGLKVIVVDEPTRGIDVGAKSEIFALIDRLAGEGLAVVMMTSEMPELLGLADRIAVMAEGRITAMMSRDEATQEKILNAAIGKAKARARMSQATAFHGDERRSHLAAVRGSSPHQELALLICLLLVIAFFSVTAENFFSAAQHDQRARPGLAGADRRHRLRHRLHFGRGRHLDRLAARDHRDAADRRHERHRLAGARHRRARCCSALLIGIVNGYLAAYAGINSLIVTLGTMFVMRGGVYLYTGQRAIPDDADARQLLSSSSDGRLFGVDPLSGGDRLVLLVAFAYIMRHRPFGRQVYAVGGNPEVARLAGYDVRRVKFICFLISALLATVAGIILAARVGSAQHTCRPQLRVPGGCRDRARRRQPRRRHRQPVRAWRSAC